GGFLIVAAILTTGWKCATWESARAAVQGDSSILPTDGGSQAPPGEVLSRSGRTESPEAVFIFRSADRGKKTVSLIVAGTSGPILCRPRKDDIRVFVGGRLVGIGSLRPGSRIAIQLDPTNCVIQDIRSFEHPGKATVPKSANELAQLDGPSVAEVLRALQ